MSKIFVVVVATVVILSGEAVEQLCSVKKGSNACICKRITDEQNSIVTEADCARIDLETFPDQAQLVQDLNFLDLSHNNIANLDPQTKFSSVTLQTLDLSYNRITSVGDGFFTSIPNLRKLILRHNDITVLDDDNVFPIPKLLYLDLSFNNIKTLRANIFAPLVQLQVLDLSYNNASLGEWLAETPNSLRVSLGINPNISTLRLDNIGLKDLHNVSFNDYANLKHLSLADNHFTEVPRVPYSVEYLDLSGSGIEVLQAKELSYHSLKILKLERMKMLHSVHHYAFYNLQALEDLSLKNCHNLKEFNELVFGLIRRNTTLALRRLSLSGNGLQTLNSTYRFLFNNLDFIDLTDNPWKCDCDLLWLQEFDNLYRIDNVRCSSPFYLSSKNLFDIVDEDVPSCYPQKYGKKSHRVLIATLILLVLILSSLVAYLIYYTPNWYGKRSRGVGPQSPYSATPTQE
jgi:Leucine-rich repeat (LRR) protein